METTLRSSYDDVWWSLFRRVALNYKSIRQVALDAVQAGALELLEPSFDSDPVKRVMLLHADLAKLLDQATQVRRIGRLKADLEAFVKGDELSVSLTPFDHQNAYLGLLDPAHEGIWEIRSRDPQPGMRVFGRFAYQDAFVALGWHLRSRSDPLWPGKKPLGNGRSLAYQIAQIETIDRWKELFPEHDSINGGDVGKLLSEKYNLV